MFGYLVLALFANSQVWQEGSTFPWGGGLASGFPHVSMSFNFTSYGEIQLKMYNTRAEILIAAKQVVDENTIDPNEPPRLLLDNTGNVRVQDFFGQTTQTLSPNKTGMGIRNSPFKGKIDFDRRFRVRNSRSEIVWEFPEIPDSVDEDLLDSNKGNYISQDEKLISPNGKWYLTVNNKGQLVSNTGFFFNSPPRALNNPHTFVVNQDGTVGLYDSYGIKIKLNNIPSSQADPSANFFAGITDSGSLYMSNNDGDIVWQQDITGRTLQKYNKVISYKSGLCLEVRNINNIYKIIMTECNDSNESQNWNIDTDGFLRSYVTTKCLSKSLTWEDCGPTRWYYHNDKLSFEDQCIEGGTDVDSGISMKKCADVETQVWFIGDKLPLPKLDYEEVVAPMLGKCLSFNVTTKKMELSDCNGQDNQQWSFKDKNIRNKANPTLCIQQDLTFIAKCKGEWEYNTANLHIKHIPSEKVLDCSSGLTLNQGNDRNNPWQIFGKKNLIVPQGLSFEEITSIHTKKCINFDQTNDRATLFDCNEQDNQKWALKDGVFRPQKNPLKCLNKDLSISFECNIDNWEYNKNYAYIKYSSTGSVLDSNNGLHLSQGWDDNEFQKFGSRDKWIQEGTNFEEITNIYMKKCLGANAGDKMRIYNCNKQDNQKVSITNGRIRMKDNPYKCLQKDMTFSARCDGNIWSYDRNSGKIFYIPENGILDAEGELHVSNTLTGNVWQIFGDRSRWVPDDPCVGKQRDPNRLIAGADCGRDRISKGQCVGNLCIFANGEFRKGNACVERCFIYGDRLILQTDGNLVLYNGNGATWSTGLFGTPSDLVSGPDGVLRYSVVNGRKTTNWSF